MKSKLCAGCSDKFEKGNLFFRYELHTEVPGQPIKDKKSDYCWSCDEDIRRRGIEALDINPAEFGMHALRFISTELYMPTEELNGRGEAIAEELARDL